MISIFLNVVLPVFIVAGFGFALARAFRFPILPVNLVTLYVLMPAFIFTSLLPVDFTSEQPLKIAVFAIVLTLVMLVVGFVVARALRLDRVTTSALLLIAAFPNLGNYGLSVMLFAFGQAGVAIGSVLFSVQTLFALTLAIFIASNSSASLASSLGQVVRQPAFYAVVAALAVKVAHLSVPAPIMSAIALPAQAAIPVMLLVLGMQIAASTGIEEPRLVSIGIVTRLVVGALVGWLLAVLLGIEGLARSVVILGSAMPTAVFTTLTAAQYGARPRLVSDAVIAGTLASIVSVTVVLAILSGSASLL